jgi:hypothetical protein
MSATITWQIQWMNAYPEVDGQTDVVISAGWACNGEQVEGGTNYNSSIRNVASFTLNTEQPFTPYADLTQEQVLGWVWSSGVDQAVTEAAVQQQIDNLINPPIVSPPLPWATPTPVE